MRSSCIIALCVLLVSCANRGQPRPPQNDIERLVFFAERTSDGSLHEISGPLAGDASGKVQTVAWNQPVDVNSLIEIRLDKSAVAPPVPAGEAEAAVTTGQALVARSERLKTLVKHLAAYVEARQVAHRAWAAQLEVHATAPDDVALVARARQEADAAIQASAARLKPMLDALQALYPDTLENADERAQVDDAFTALRRDGDAGAKLSALLQAEIDAVDRAAREKAESARERGTTHVRLEAFHLAGGQAAEPAAIHLEGYDEIDAKEVRVVDRFGLNLSPVERAQLESLAASTVEIAEALERVRTGEAELSEAFQEATSEVGAKLGAFVTEAEQLRAEWTTRTSAESWTETTQAVRAFIDSVSEQLEQVAETERTRLKEEAEAELAAWREHSEFAENVTATLELVSVVRDAWSASPVNVVDATNRTLALAGKLRDVIDSAAELEQVVDRARALVEGRIQAWKTELPSALHGALEGSYESSGLKGEIEGWQKLIERSLALLRPVADYVGFTRSRPLGTSIRAPGAIDVPLDDAPNTAIDLTRTDRKAGDRIEVRASTIEKGANGGPDKTTGTSSASFVVEKLDWHADLVPAVVLATADQLAGDSDSGGFTASLSWMLRYGPRPDEDGALANSARWLGWGIGPHATLLNFDPDEDIEIGLGLTLGLWGDRLLVGAGANPLADDDSGRFYYFIGSSLIPLLQALE